MRDACRWLERNYTHPNFFLWVDAFDPHEPWDPPRYYVDMYDPGYQGQVVDHPQYGPQGFLTPEELRHCRALYAGEVTLVDTWVGRLFETVDHLGLYDDTAVLLLSDHGHYIGDHGLVGKSGHGPDGPYPLYQEISHIVMMARVPGGARGARMEALVQPADVMPTVLELTEMDRPEGLHGISLVPALYGQPLPQRPIIVTSPGLTDDPERPVCSAITDGEWALQYRGPRYPSELHRLSDDPFQLCNVYAQERGQAERLHRAYVDLLREVGTDPAKLSLRTELPA
jgi:arylsulfatase A-like enzyme